MRFSRLRRRLFPPDGPRYELVDTSLAIAWIAIFGLLVFPPPPTSIEALGAAAVLLGGERDLGFVVATMMLLAAALSYFPVRVFEFRGQPRIIYPVKIGYQIGRLGTSFMAANYGLTVIVFGWRYAAHFGAWLINSLTSFELSLVELPGLDGRATLRAALVYVMIYGYAFRRLKRDNRVRP